MKWKPLQDKKKLEEERQKELDDLFAVAIKQPKVPAGADRPGSLQTGVALCLSACGQAGGALRHPGLLSAEPDTVSLVRAMAMQEEVVV